MARTINIIHERSFQRARVLFVALFAAIVLECFFTFLTIFLTLWRPGAGSAFGGPLIVGSWRSCIQAYLGCAEINSWAAFGVNVAMTWAIFGPFSRTTVRTATMLVGACAAFATANVLYEPMFSRVPFNTSDPPLLFWTQAQAVLVELTFRRDLAVLWLESMAGAVAFAGLARAWIERRRMSDAN